MIYKLFREYKKATASTARELLDGNYILKNGVEKRGLHAYTKDGYICEYGTATEAISHFTLMIEMAEYHAKQV